MLGEDGMEGATMEWLVLKVDREDSVSPVAERFVAGAQD
jgi:hypothetical protein